MATPIEKLLRAREAQGLRWGVSVRLTAIALGAVMLPATSITLTDTLVTALLLAVGAAISIYAYRLALAERDLARGAWMCLGFDAVTLVTLPVSWYQAAGGAAISPSFLLKNDFVPVCLMVIAANGLTLRPLYPLLITAVSLAVYLGFLAYGWGDPRPQFDWSVYDGIMGQTVQPGLLLWRFMTLAFFGGLFAWTAKAGRRTIQEAVELEHSYAEARRLQGELVLQGRLSALAGLVAGVAHEINSPLGVVRSAVQTMGSAAKKLEAGPHPRALEALNESVETATLAAARMDGLVRRLKEFAGLDQAEVRELDLEAALDRTVELTDAETRGAVRVERDYAGGVALRCRAKEIHQVFYTLLQNAFEAMGGEGTLRLRTEKRDGAVRVKIEDTGRGMSAEELNRLFEIRFAAKSKRVGMGMGLAMARSIVESHGGSIRAESEPGRGTTVEITLRDEAPKRAGVEDAGGRAGRIGVS